MNNPIPQLLTVSQVAEVLGCSSGNVYALIDRGELPFIQTGVSKGYRISPEDLAEFIQARKRVNGSPQTKVSRPSLKHIRV